MTVSDFFVNALYNSTSIPEAIDSCINHLRQQGDGKSYLHANKLEEYKELFGSDTTLKLRNTFDGFYKVLSQAYPDLRFRIAGRRKSFVSLEQKIRRNLENNTSLDLIRDIIGTRIVLMNGTEQDCFNVMETLIDFCLKKGYIICEESLENNPPENLKTENPLTYQFYYGMTDYISSPKPNGYRSIHAVFKDKSGKFFEVQVRTFEMHVHSAYGGANHAEYKKQKYEEIKMDRSKINMPGYYYPLPSGEPMDMIGLEHSLELLQRNKTF